MSAEIQFDRHGRPDPPLAADEATTLLAFLDHQRGTVDWKTRDLDAAGYARRSGPSIMTVGGMLKHLACVEDLWCSQRLAGNPPAEPWNGIDAESDADWDWETAGDDDPEGLIDMWRAAVERSRHLVGVALESGGLDHRAVWIDDWYQQPPTLRWILLHLHREYARHCGHLDLIREAIDGSTGE